MSDPSTPQENARSLHDPKVRYAQTHLVIKNYALEVCQLLFAGDNPTGLRWDPQKEKSQISIVDKYTFNLDQVAQNPTIVANRGPLAWMKTSGFRQVQEINMRTNRRVYTDLVRGGVTLSCFSVQGLEAESIAAYVAESFQSLRDVLRALAAQGMMVASHLGFFRIEASLMGEEALVKGGSRPNLSVVPVSLSVMVQRRWAVVPQNARQLKGISVRTNTIT